MAKYQKKLEDDIRCLLEYGLAIFGGKWRSRIICVLSANEKLRYSQIRKEMYNITDAVLSATLKDLMEDGIVDRKSYDEIPPRVEYSLTQKENLSFLFYKASASGQIVSTKKKDKMRWCNVRSAIIVDKGKRKMFTYTEEKKFTKEQVQQLFLSVNWISGKYPERLYKALMNSSTVLTVWDEKKLIGLTRVLDDSEMLAQIHYVSVDPDYQGMEIAGKMIEYNQRKNIKILCI